ncbi:MAG: hypothetical protein LW875_05820 [Proteobacteria bacterium]|jgi:REP element-mobilizing transposase RayT|nr:hypothetical protein [Pseudomonadota bacterium]
MKQLPLPGLSKKQLFFGGSHLCRSHAKVKRPLSSKLPVHVVLKSSKAVRSLSFQAGQNPRRIQQILKKNSRRWGVRILKQSNNFNHLHLLLAGTRRPMMISFLRSITGEIAQAVTGRWKGGRLSHHSLHRRAGMSLDRGDAHSTRFWDQRPFTRVVVGYRGYLTAKDYIEMNQMESVGFFSEQRRTRFIAAKRATREQKSLDSG